MIYRKCLGDRAIVFPAALRVALGCWTIPCWLRQMQKLLCIVKSYYRKGVILVFKVAGGLEVNFPKMYKIKQKFKDEKVSDIKSEVNRELDRVKIKDMVREKPRIGVAVGSRGISNIKEVTKSVLDKLKEAGCEPFIIPSMGSHGNADAEKQKELLSHYGITEDSMDTPIHSSMEVEKVGTVDEDFEVYVDKVAMQSDGIVLINRIKSHTEIFADIESGLMKMMVIGLGNHIGCSSIHSRGAHKLAELVPKAGRLIKEKAPILCGLAIVENSFGNTYKLEALMPDEIENREKELLVMAKENMAKLPVNDIDVLVVEEMGKNISGTGIDVNVIGRVRVWGVEETGSPSIKKIVLLGVTEESEGSAVGVGLGDIITRKMLDQIDFSATYTNTIAANCIERAFTPLVAENEHDAVALAMKLTRNWDQSNIRMIRIKNTLKMDEIEVSHSVWEDIKSKENVETLEGPYTWSY